MSRPVRVSKSSFRPLDKGRNRRAQFRLAIPIPNFRSLFPSPTPCSHSTLPVSIPRFRFLFPRPVSIPYYLPLFLFVPFLTDRSHGEFPRARLVRPTACSFAGGPPIPQRILANPARSSHGVFFRRRTAGPTANSREPGSFVPWCVLSPIDRWSHGEFSR